VSFGLVELFLVMHSKDVEKFNVFVTKEREKLSDRRSSLFYYWS
jgi:hypothetical protein